jgi:hypothetical protein
MLFTSARSFLSVPNAVLSDLRVIEVAQDRRAFTAASYSLPTARTSSRWSRPVAGTTHDASDLS